MIQILIALIILGFCVCLVGWLVRKFAPPEFQFPLMAGLAVICVIGVLVLVARSGLLAGL